MVQVLASIFFSAALFGAVSVVVAMIADNLADIRRAFGLGEALPPLPSPRVRVRSVAYARTALTPPGLPQWRAAA